MKNGLGNKHCWIAMIIILITTLSIQPAISLITVDNNVSVRVNQENASINVKVTVTVTVSENYTDITSIILFTDESLSNSYLIAVYHSSIILD